MSYPCTFYIRPNGRAVVSKISHISPAAELFFTKFSIQLSMEGIGAGRCAIRADYGRRDEHGDPIEFTYVTAPGQTCIAALDRVAAEVEKLL